MTPLIEHFGGKKILALALTFAVPVIGWSIRIPTAEILKVLPFILPLAVTYMSLNTVLKKNRNGTP